ncbi:flagellar FliJ protein [Cryobacterium sp. CAN_C3]|uniref:flagellar export protein FliJ n=1 Tax=unclassified Cryobacterium TaxID=2649013 RepID=UPI0018C9A48F|nr:flagellar export protein FliJ [Cryobacterium sp. CAN_C3]MEC5153988.1 flagellar FliJ protein [Cryobacterium sp. CAN_C3]
MKRGFPLAGLLRLRRLQQDQAALDLAEANARVAAIEARRGRARSALNTSGATPQTVAAMNAMAAARSSSRSMLADLDALGRTNQTSADQAQTVFDAARAESIALEKLEVRHLSAVAAADLHAEQIVLDEIASTRWHRDQDNSDPRSDVTS